MNTGQNPKSYNNPREWEKFENNPNTVYVKTDVDEIAEYTELDNNNTEEVDTEEVDTDNTLEETAPENFDDVLQLTEYNGGLVTESETNFVVADYEKIDMINIDKQQQQLAKKFVSKITKFILEFNDVQLTEDHKNYIKQVGQLQLQNLQDLLTLVAVNKQMIGNIVARVNAVQAEDYPILNSYNNLINQHIKLIREVSTLYKSIPNTMKKMRADILSNQELENNSEQNEEMITEDYGESQFNNSKQLLRSILDKRKKKQESENTDK